MGLETLQLNRDYRGAQPARRDEVFSAALFYSILRAEGCNPIVCKGALLMNFRRTPATIHAGQWAARHDPDGAARVEYARSVWVARSQRTETIDLG